MMDIYEGMDGDWTQWDTRLASQKARDRKDVFEWERNHAIALMAHTEACDDPADLRIEAESVAHCPSEEESLHRRVAPGEAWVDAKRHNPSAPFKVPQDDPSGWQDEPPNEEPL